MLPYNSSSEKRRGQQCMTDPSNNLVLAKMVLEPGLGSQTNMLGKTSALLNWRNKTSFSILANGKASPTFRWINSSPSTGMILFWCNSVKSMLRSNSRTITLALAIFWTRLKRPMHCYKLPRLSLEMTTHLLLASEAILKLLLLAFYHMTPWPRSAMQILNANEERRFCQ